jgi:uncharacterized protein YjbI with pentapeptide repeats
VSPPDDDEVPGVIESRHMLERLAGEQLLVGRTLRGFPAVGAGLREADLDAVVIEKVDLQDADWRVHLETCDLTEIELEGAEIMGCELSQVVMARARLRGARLQGTRFHETELYGADFTRAMLMRTTFAGYRGGTFSLSRVVFRDAALIEVDLSHSNLYSSDFRGALLVRCDLRAANLCEVDFRGAHLVGCETAGADIDGAVVQ